MVAEVRGTQKNGSQGLAVIGGGITGLTAAYYAIQNGQDPASITVYEGSGRLGGKIKTGYRADGGVVNMGAEFIDSEHTQLIALCNQLGVKLKPSGDEGREAYQRPNGKMMSGTDFHAAYTPLHIQVMRDKQEVLAYPDGALAKRVNAMSMEQYLEDVRRRTPVDAHPTLWQQLKHLIAFDGNRVSRDICAMAVHAFASETGRTGKEINALQFLHEASAEAGSFLASDCAYRVEGGTENIIKALEAELRAKGVKFEAGKSLARVQKTSEGIALGFGDGTQAQTGKMVLALPAYALGGIEGLDTVGMPPQLQQFIHETQYTSGYKFTVKLKPGAKPQDGAFFADGYQVWSANKDEVTFLINNDPSKGNRSPQEVLNQCLTDYAKARGDASSALYDRTPGNQLLSNPGSAACYASPAPGCAMQMEHLAGALDGMAEHGVALAGTYLPLKTKGSIGLGFMECGVDSSARAIDRLVVPEKERAQWMQQLLTPQQAQQTSLSR